MPRRDTQPQPEATPETESKPDRVLCRYIGPANEWPAPFPACDEEVDRDEANARVEAYPHHFTLDPAPHARSHSQRKTREEPAAHVPAAETTVTEEATNGF